MAKSGAIVLMLGMVAVLSSCETTKGTVNGAKKDISNTTKKVKEIHPMDNIKKLDAWLQKHAW